MEEEYVIIVAGGTGTRMKNKLPKQFILIDDKPIILHTINKFLNYNASINLVIAMQEEYFDYWKTLCKTHSFELDHQLIPAGKERYYTVKNALKALPNSSSIVAIHDAVRPMVSYETINNCFEEAKIKNNCIPIVSLEESIRKITSKKTKTVDRNKYVSVQTPQCFNIQKIKEAYQQPFKNTFTDDASVYESIGGKINVVEGNIENKKITTPMDLVFAEYFLKNQKN